MVVEDESDLQKANAYVNMDEDIYEYIEEINENCISMLKLCNNDLYSKDSLFG